MKTLEETIKQRERAIEDLKWKLDQRIKQLEKLKKKSKRQ